MGSEWQTVTTDDLIASGVLVINDGYRAKNSEMGEDGLPFARAGNINGRIDLVGADVLAGESVRKAGEKLSEPGDSVFTSKGTVGRFAFVGEGAPRFVYSPQLCFWRVKDKSALDSRFVFYWLQGREAGAQLDALKGQTDMADYVSLRDQRAMELTLPPISEQRRIAGVLGALDDKIEHNLSLRRGLIDAARCIFEDLPGELVRLGDVAALDKGVSYKGSGLGDGGFPMFNLANFTTAGWLDRDGFKYYRGEYRDRHVVRTGDLLIANTDLTQRRAILGQPILVPNGIDKALFTHHVFAVRFRQPEAARLRLLTFFALQSRDFRVRAETFATGTTVAALPRDAVLDFEIRVPEERKLELLTRTADALIRRAWNAEVEANSIAAVRDALLPKLISGWMRVPESYDPDDVLGTVIERAAIAD